MHGPMNVTVERSEARRGEATRREARRGEARRGEARRGEATHQYSKETDCCCSSISRPEQLADYERRNNTTGIAA